MLKETLAEEIYKTSVNLQEMNIRAINIRLTITRIKVKQKRIFYKNKKSKLRVKPRGKPNWCSESKLICCSLWCDVLCCTCRVLGSSLAEHLFTNYCNKTLMKCLESFKSI